MELTAVIAVAAVIAVMVGAFWMFYGRAEQCTNCGERAVTSQTHKLTSEQIKKDWQHIAPQPNDSITGPAGMGATIVLERPQTTIFQPLWLFGDPKSRVQPGLAVDGLSHATCKRCGHETIQVSSCVQKDHPEVRKLHDQASHLSCLSCGGGVQWNGDLWSDEDSMKYYEYGIVVDCPSCKAQYGANTDVTELTPFDD